MNRYIALKKIVDLGSFSRAAETMGYSQSAVSQMISSLEEELSIKLVNRFRSGARLTLEGEELFPYIERMIYQYDAVQEKTKEIKGLQTGTIRMGTLSSISTHWLPEIIKQFQILYPGVDFVIHQGDYTSIQNWIKTGMIDFTQSRQGEGKACWDCHTQVPHTGVSNLNSSPGAIVPLHESPVPDWLKKMMKENDK